MTFWVSQHEWQFNNNEDQTKMRDKMSFTAKMNTINSSSSLCCHISVRQTRPKVMHDGHSVAVDRMRKQNIGQINTEFCHLNHTNKLLMYCWQYYEDHSFTAPVLKAKIRQ